MNNERFFDDSITEDILIARMEERFREGNVSEELAEYFEFEGREVELPLFMRGTKERKRPRGRRREERTTEDLRPFTTKRRSCKSSGVRTP